jgi:hypothetical protein
MFFNKVSKYAGNYSSFLVLGSRTVGSTSVHANRRILRQDKSPKNLCNFSPVVKKMLIHVLLHIAYADLPNITSNFPPKAVLPANRDRNFVVMNFGCTFSTVARSWIVTWSKVTRRVKTLVTEVCGRDLCLTQIIQYVQTFVLSKIWHKAEVFRHRRSMSGNSS